MANRFDVNVSDYYQQFIFRDGEQFDGTKIISFLAAENPIVDNGDGTHTISFINNDDYTFTVNDIESVTEGDPGQLVITFADGTSNTVNVPHIVSGVANDDGTITFTFTDGSTVTTTGDLTGPQGLQGPGRFTVYQVGDADTTPNTPQPTSYDISEDFSSTNGQPSGWTITPDSPGSGQATYAITVLYDAIDAVAGIVTLTWSNVFIAGSAGPSGPAGVSITGASVPEDGANEGHLVLTRDQGQADIVTDEVVAGVKNFDAITASGQTTLSWEEGDGTPGSYSFTVSGLTQGDAITLYATSIAYDQGHLVASVDGSNISIYRWNDSTPEAGVALTDSRWTRVADNTKVDRPGGTTVTNFGGHAVFVDDDGATLNHASERLHLNPLGAGLIANTSLEVTGDIEANTGTDGSTRSFNAGTDVHFTKGTTIYLQGDTDLKKVYYDPANDAGPLTTSDDNEIATVGNLSTLADEITAILIERNSAGQTLEQWEDLGNSAGSFVADSSNSITEVSLANNLNLLANDNYSKMIVATENGNDYHFDLLRFQALNGRLILQTDNLVTRLANIDTAISNAGGDATKKEAATSTWQASLADQYVIGDEVTVIRNGSGLINDRRVYIRTNANPGATTTDPGAQTYTIQGDSDPFPNIYISANGNWGLLRRTGIQWRVGQDYIEGDKITQIVDDLPQDYFVIKRHTSTSTSKPSDPGTVYVKNGSPDAGNNTNDIFQRPIESIELLTNVPNTVYAETDTGTQVTVGSVGDAAGNTTTFILGTNGIIQQGGLASNLEAGHLVGFTTTPNYFTTVADNGGNGFEVTLVETVELGDGNDYTRVTVSGDLNLIPGSNNFLYRLAHQSTLVQAHQLNFNRGIEDTPLGGNNPNGLVEIGLTSTGVTAGEYINATINVDEQGRITTATKGNALEVLPFLPADNTQTANIVSVDNGDNDAGDATGIYTWNFTDSDWDLLETGGTPFNPTEYDPTQVYQTGALVTADGELFQCTATTTAQPGNSTIETEGDNWRSITETLASVDSIATFALLNPDNSIIRVGEIMCVINDPSPYNNGLYRVISHNAGGTSVARIDELNHLHEIVEGIIQHSGSSASFEFPDDNPAFITGTLVDESKFTTVEGTKSTSIPSLDTVGPKFEPGNGRMTLIYNNLSDTQITQLEAAVGSDLAFRTTAGGVVTAGNVEDTDNAVAAQSTYHFLLKSVSYRLGTGRRQLNFVMRDLSQATDFVSAFTFLQNTGITGNAGNLYIPTDGPLVTNLIDNISLVNIVAISGGGGTSLTTSEQATLTGLNGISDNAFAQRSGTGYAGGSVITGVALGSHIGEITVTTNNNGTTSTANIGVDHIVFSDDTLDWDGAGIPDNSFGMDGQLALSNAASAAYIKRSGAWSSYIFPSSQVATTFGALRTVVDQALSGNASQTVIEPNTTNQNMALRGNGTGTVILDDVSIINTIQFDLTQYTSLLIGVGPAEITTTATGYETDGLSYTHNGTTYYRLFASDGLTEILTTNQNNTDSGDIVYTKTY